MSSFNLIDEPWIPVRFLDGRRAELGIRETLLSAGKIAAIESPSPLVVAALHRFLLAVLYRALDGPTDIEQAKMLFDTGLPAERIVSYLEKWRSRLFLFDEDFPFAQIAEFEPKVWRAWTALAAEHNADNAKVLFDHVDVNAPGKIEPSEAVRWLLAAQTFAISSANSELGYTRTAPSATAVIVLPMGRQLQDTLLYSLVPENKSVLENDLPAWERTPETLEQLRSGIKRGVAGLCDLYTWPSRTVRLQRDEELRVESIAFASGVGISADVFTDPMVAYRIDDKGGRFALQFRERGLWREFDSLLPDDAHLAPKVIEHASALSKGRADRKAVAILTVGQAKAKNKAKIEFWRMEQFAFPSILRDGQWIRAEIRSLLDLAEEVQRALWLGCRTFARDTLSRGDRDPSAQDISKFIRQMPVISQFWSKVEPGFHARLAEFAVELDPDDIRASWVVTLREALRSAWESHRASASLGDAWSLRALVKAEAPIRVKLADLSKEIKFLQPKEVVT